MNKSKGTTPKALHIKEVISTTTNNGFGESFRVLYYGKASSVPFMWESQPGTPKHTLTESSLPSLTPPPSYNQFNQKYSNSSKKSGGFLRKIFLDNSSSRKTSSFSSSSVSSSSSSSMYMHSAPATPMRRKMSPVKFGSEDDCGGGGSPTSTLCLGDHGIKKGYRIKKFKKAMLFFVR